MMTGAGLILKERRRQIDVEGWTAEHDYEHEDTALMRAAVCYLLYEIAAQDTEDNDILVNLVDFLRGVLWPWCDEWWKPEHVDRNLVRAGALVAAAIDKIQREEVPNDSPHHTTRQEKGVDDGNRTGS